MRGMLKTLTGQFGQDRSHRSKKGFQEGLALRKRRDDERTFLAEKAGEGKVRPHAPSL